MGQLFDNIIPPDCYSYSRHRYRNNIIRCAYTCIYIYICMCEYRKFIQNNANQQQIKLIFNEKCSI